MLQKEEGIGKQSQAVFTEVLNSMDLHNTDSRHERDRNKRYIHTSTLLSIN